MLWLLKLYPKPWRARYGEEFAAILRTQPASLGLFVDVLAGALDARMLPQVKPVVAAGENAMAADLMKRCAAGGPQLSSREQYLAGAVMIAGAFGVGAAYVWLRHRFGATPAVEALGYSALPAIFILYTQMAYLRNRSVPTQGILVGGSYAAIYLLYWAACAIAVRL